MSLKLQEACERYGIMSADFLWALSNLFKLLDEKYGKHDPANREK
jgi:hypothetical protein